MSQASNFVAGATIVSRHADDFSTLPIEEQGARVRAWSGTARKSSDERAERKARFDRESAANQTAEVCGKCGRPLRAEEPIWRDVVAAGYVGHMGRYSRHYAPVCETCHRTTVHWVSGSCAMCGRPVHFRRDRRRREHVFCCHRCAWTWANKARGAREAVVRSRKVCAVCGNPFQPNRTDGTTCKPACRQKAYRQRSVASSLVDRAALVQRN